MINKGGYYFDVVVFLIRIGIGFVGEKKIFYFIWYMFFKFVYICFYCFVLVNLNYVN